MFRYAINKLGYSLLVIWGVVSVIFVLFAVVPADPARMALGQRPDSASLAAVRADLGLDKPLTLQYVKYLNDLSPLSVHQRTQPDHYFYYTRELYKHAFSLIQTADWALILKAPYLRRSFQDRRNVSEIIAETLPNTFILAIAAMLFATFAGIIMGVFSALYKNSWYDRLSLLVSSLGMSVPSFFAAILFGWIFAYLLGDITGLNLTGNITELDDTGSELHLRLKNLILPALTLGIRPLAVFIQLTRNSLLEVLQQDYIRTARAKGANEFRVIVHHALRGALSPVVTAASGWFASMMAGVVFVEFIFGWKGLGYVMVTALNNFDLPLVMSAVLVISIIFVIITIAVDLIYVWIDPRVRM